MDLTLHVNEFYVRHARGISFDDVEVSFEAEDRRPAFVLDDVQDVRFHGVTAEKAAGEGAARDLRDDGRGDESAGGE